MKDNKINYHRLSSELDEIFIKLQSTDLDIDEAVEAFERGVRITKELEEYIKNAKNKVTKIKADFNIPDA